MLSIPYQGLGNAAVATVATGDQRKRFGTVWASMAITEPAFGSDSAAVSTTAVLDGDEWVLNGEKIFVTAGQRSTHIVVWATVDRSLGRAAIKSFVVPRDVPGLSVARLEHKLGIKVSDTAVLLLQDCRIPEDNILGSPDVNAEKGFAGVMRTFDNTRPTGTDVTLKAMELAGTRGYSQRTLLEKWGRDSTIFDIFEGTQQIQQLIVARRVPGKTGSEPKWPSRNSYSCTSTSECQAGTAVSSPAPE